MYLNFIILIFRTCYVAPERFKTRSNSSANISEAGLSTSSTGFLGDESSSLDVETGELLPSMDIFSVGCCIIELFTDTPPFSFSNLLAYRAGEFDPTGIIAKIEDPDIKELVAHMIQRDPSTRLTANEYLSKQRGKAFPEFFYTFLQSYMQLFCTDPSMTPDQKINKYVNGPIIVKPSG